MLRDSAGGPYLAAEAFSPLWTLGPVDPRISPTGRFPGLARFLRAGCPRCRELPGSVAFLPSFMGCLPRSRRVFPRWGVRGVMRVWMISRTRILEAVDSAGFLFAIVPDIRWFLPDIREPFGRSNCRLFVFSTGPGAGLLVSSWKRCGLCLWASWSAMSGARLLLD